ncbi:tannase and feruloyl esterase [Aspergillus eucalypticola CBS 122712]|uniref:Carboxylic ester hydrolase n=1 Tax=Aspergillus eucalypticola (strain CBS 122712 / IBT 29274) TaxID=1448314 RepID=A0A317V6Q6_ASPEC|nr:tannase and feruloyl esterase [Aspergillus eucalypticola CBS 122712]PWY67830.1 tannase and feruloyl esterase [Aspergillus eucalypticola CBS 122712]
MRRAAMIAGLTATAAHAASLADVCTTANVKAALPTSVYGLTMIPSSVTASPVYNASTSGQVFFPDATYDYCGITFNYTHNGRGDTVKLQYWLPAPESFENRFLATGGMAYMISGGSSYLPGGVMYGAVAGTTDGGFGGELDIAFLLANGTINYEALYSMGYHGIGELTMIGKEFTKNFYSMGEEKLYTYYQGCSEGGREGWSQIQKYPGVYDGVIPGAPAIRYSQQQANHLYSNIVEKTLGYYPPPCELEKIVNATIDACDSLDGKVDGVVARTDLCQLHFNINSTIGLPYHCAARSSSGIGLGFGKRGTDPPSTAPSLPRGLHDSKGRRAYISYQPTASFSDAETSYNSETGEYELSIASTGGEWVAKFLELRDAENLSTLDNVTYDTLRDWMELGWKRYEDVMQTTWPDLTKFEKAGVYSYQFFGLLLQLHPQYHYCLFLVPGASHCSTNDVQANGPFPQINLAIIINWIKKGIVPYILNAIHLAGDTKFNCVYDQVFLDTWDYIFDAYKMPLY